MRHSVGTAFVAVVAAAAVGWSFDVGYNVARETALVPGYLMLTAAFTLGAAALVALIAGGPLGVSVALSAWSGLNVGLLRDGDLARSILLGALAAAATGLGIAARAPEARRPLPSGIAVGSVLALALLIAPRALQVAGLSVEEPARSLVLVVLFATGLAALGLWSRATRWVGRPLPSDAWLSLAVMGAALLATSISVAAMRSERELSPAAARRPEGSAPPIVLLVLDTVRADQLSIYGAERDTTPQLRRLVEESGGRARVYPWAFSPSNWTIPGHASLLTGLLPTEHGAHTQRSGDLKHSPLASTNMTAERTLAETLGEAGYRTGAIFANPNLMRVRGMERGFDVYVRPPPPRKLALLGEFLRVRLLPSWYAGSVGVVPDAKQVNQRVLEFLESCGGESCFVIANYMEAHTPYVPSAPYAGTYTGDPDAVSPTHVRVPDSPEVRKLARARYQEEIRGLDASIGRLRSALERRGILERGWLIITSDHGEAFGEHGTAGHASSLYNEQLRVPLVIHPPAGETLPRGEAVVDLIDLASTLAAIGGGHLGGEGRDLRRKAFRPRPVRAEFFGGLFTDEEGFGPLVTEAGRAVVWRGRKLIDHGSQRELYRLRTDPTEQADLAEERRGAVSTLARKLPPLEVRHSSTDARDTTGVSPGQRKALEALGYVRDHSGPE